MNREQLLGKRIVVIGGGWSDEREISLESATEVPARAPRGGLWDG